MCLLNTTSLPSLELLSIAISGAGTCGSGAAGTTAAGGRSCSLSSSESSESDLLLGYVCSKGIDFLEVTAVACQVLSIPNCFHINNLVWRRVKSRRKLVSFLLLSQNSFAHCHASFCSSRSPVCIFLHLLSLFVLFSYCNIPGVTFIRQHGKLCCDLPFE